MNAEIDRSKRPAFRDGCENDSPGPWLQGCASGYVEEKLESDRSEAQMKIAYQVVIKETSEGFFVEFPDLQEAVTEGKTREEAFFNAAEVLDLTLEGRIDEGTEIPVPGEHEGGDLDLPFSTGAGGIVGAVGSKRSFPGRLGEDPWYLLACCPAPGKSPAFTHAQTA